MVYSHNTLRSALRNRKRCPIKKVLLKILQNSEEHLYWSLFFNIKEETILKRLF